MACINYREYSFEELAALFAQGHVYYSRCPKLKGDRPGRPDCISLTRKGASALIVETALYGNTDTMKEVLTPLGFCQIKKENRPCWVKEVALPIVAANPVATFQTALQCLNKCCELTPVLLYGSRELVRLSDFIGFMTSAIPKIRYGIMLEIFGGSHLSIRRWSESLYADDSGDNWIITKLPGGKWAAWVPGDEIIPVFTDKNDARSLLGKREEADCRYSQGEQRRRPWHESAGKMAERERLPWSLTDNDLENLLAENGGQCRLHRDKAKI